MNAIGPLIGTQNDAQLHESSQSPPISAGPLRSVQDLLSALQGNAYLAMLRTTAGHLSSFLKTPVDQLKIDSLVGLGPTFRTYLKERRLKRDSIRSYSNFAAMLLRKAKDLGWEPRHPEVTNAWSLVLRVLGESGNCSQIIRYAIQQRRTPSDFSDDDLNTFDLMMRDAGRSHEYVRHLISSFRREVYRKGIADELPRISYRSRKIMQYGVPLRLFPASLKQEVTALLHWKQAPYAEKRRRRWKHRPISARNLERVITQLYGFVTNIEPTLPRESGHKPRKRRKIISSFIELVTEESIRSIMKWWLNDRKLHGECVSVNLGYLYGVLKQYPAYSGYDFSWFNSVMLEIPRDPESELRERKERKSLPYEVVDDIPRRIRERRTDVASRFGPKELALLIRDELLISWLVALPWLQLNIRQCLMSSRKGHCNLFRGTIPLGVNTPSWVKESITENPNSPFWQYHFLENETKNGHEVRSVVPRRLIPLLEEYLTHHRSILLDGADPGTLFLNEDGKSLTDNQMGTLVGELTLRYGGRRVTPHLFRDIFAYWWLKSHPEDFLTVSKKLWHRNIQTTLRHYGCKFDESQADCRVEEWRDSQNTK